MRARRAVVVAVVLVAVVSGVLVIVPRSLRVDAELRDTNPAVRADAVRRLNVDSDADQLLSTLNDDDSDVRLLSAMRLREWPTGKPVTVAERTAPALIKALKDRHAGVRRAAAESLGELWPATETALTGALTDSDPRVRAGAAFAMSWAHDRRSGREVTATQAEPLRPLLHHLLDDEASEVRQNAALALERIR